MRPLASFTESFVVAVAILFFMLYVSLWKNVNMKKSMREFFFGG
jgi:CHASE3 domain sensor protein